MVVGSNPGRASLDFSIHKMYKNINMCWNIFKNIIKKFFWTLLFCKELFSETTDLILKSLLREGTLALNVKVIFYFIFRGDRVQTSLK